ncbi:MAG: radical SAM protein [Nanoarchaeota archaeon]|nr:radical SAM protein [Nanoarchaeota archaeon]
MTGIVDKAHKVFLENFPATTWFERALFFSWYCGTADCKYCYMSTQKGKAKPTARRSLSSLLAEVLLCKKLGWRIGFLSGGKDAYTQTDFVKLVKALSEAAQERLWINAGPLPKILIEDLRPYAKGVVASIETVNPKVHADVCPSKPVEPFLKIFDQAEGLQKGMTIILGLGETMDDFPLLKSFIKEHDISKIHIYGLNPQKGTVFEHVLPPLAEYQAEWIARTRIAFPKIDIQAGIWADRVDAISLFFMAGANSISKFPAIRLFGGKEAQTIEEQANLAGREFLGSMTRLPGNISLDLIPDILKEDVKVRLDRYLARMKKRT